MKNYILLLTLVFLCINAFSQDKEAYRIYNKSGERVSYNQMITELSGGDIVMFGELHNNAISHWLQYEVTKDLSVQRDLILGAEMFEADNQEALDAYLEGEIDEKGLDSLARLWPNYETDYAPLVNFAKEKGLPFVATNIPRRFASMVFKKGFEALDTLTKKEKAWIAPLPIKFDSELPRYKQILIDMGDHATPQLVMAQAMKDATMAHFILENYKKKHLFIHYNGRYHSDYFEGIMWYLKQSDEKKKYLSITTVEQADVTKLEEENKGVADYVICVDVDVTKTY